MALEVTGRLERKLPVQNGTSARGNWSKQEFLIQTQEAYPKTICMSVWGEDKVQELSKFSLGEVLKIGVNIESREYNGRWFTDVRAWKIESSNGQMQTQQQPVAQPVSHDISTEIYQGADSEEEDMPF